MRITVIGSTSPTGLEVLKYGKTRGHKLIAFTRRPQLLSMDQSFDKVVTGDGLHKTDVLQAIDGSDAVIAIIGGKTDIAGVTKTMISSMQERNIRRLIFVSSYLLEAKRPRIFSSFARWIFRHELTELDKAEKVIQECDLDWSIYRPAHDPSTGKIRVQEQRHGFPSGPYQISRADLAKVLVDALDNNASFRKIYCVTWSKE
ncbi:NAD(P)-dependent oxidoreductase [Paenibacillus sp. MDMC362]|uniref:NAD(P)-dependent oxidoreductase n=1 Tax=Paenibacillus sp. MDMC362 TaxID=2977365 RepID=UPI0015EB6B2C|nr:NAD(P)H-binding protein [Paenibacillus sp. MDMC362]